MSWFSRQPVPVDRTAGSGDSPMRRRPPLRSLFRAWLRIGGQSFGGGSSTLLLIRRVVVEQYGWVSNDDVTATWAICQISPGINLLALTTVLGWRLGGLGGIVASLGGLLLPSVTITIALTALYRSVQHLNVIQAALRGVIPATIGLGMLMSWQLAHPVLQASRAENWRSLALSLALFVSAGLFAGLLDVPLVLVLAGAGACGAFGYRVLNRRRGERPA